MHANMDPAMAPEAAALRRESMPIHRKVRRTTWYVTQKQESAAPKAKGAGTVVPSRMPCARNASAKRPAVQPNRKERTAPSAGTSNKSAIEPQRFNL
jgi:hypothetical protein